MSITVPAPGDPVTAAWGESVADQLNRMIPLGMSADATTTSASYADVDGLTFPVVSGTCYNISLNGLYTVGGTSTGFGFAFHLSSGATGTCRLLSEILSSSTTDSTPDTGWLTADDTADGGTSTTDTTLTHFWALSGLYQCSASGTFAIRFKRNGTSTTVTILKGSGGLVVTTA